MLSVICPSFSVKMANQTHSQVNLNCLYIILYYSILLSNFIITINFNVIYFVLPCAHPFVLASVKLLNPSTVFISLAQSSYEKKEGL